MAEYNLVLDFSTHIDGGMLDHVYLLNNLSQDFDVKTLKKCVNISDHDVVKIRLLPKETDSDIEEDRNLFIGFDEIDSDDDEEDYNSAEEEEFDLDFFKNLIK